MRSKYQALGAFPEVYDKVRPEKSVYQAPEEVEEDES